MFAFTEIYNHHMNSLLSIKNSVCAMMSERTNLFALQPRSTVTALPDYTDVTSESTWKTVFEILLNPFFI